MRVSSWIPIFSARKTLVEKTRARGKKLLTMEMRRANDATVDQPTNGCYDSLVVY